MEINKMHQTGTVPITCLSGWLCSKCNTMYAREGGGGKLGQAEVFVSVISLLCLCCISAFLFFFHGYLSHPLRPRRGGVLFEPKCPSVCSGKYSLGIKPKPQASTP